MINVNRSVCLLCTVKVVPKFILLRYMTSRHKDHTDACTNFQALGDLIEQISQEALTGHVYILEIRPICYGKWILC